MQFICHRCLLICLACVISSIVSEEPPFKSVRLKEKTFEIPSGLTLTTAASLNQTKRPIMADFDDQGRLFVAESSGSNAPVEEQVQERPHRILCLEDRDQDGFFETSHVYADNLMLPEGILCHQGYVYCGAPPEIWRFRDSNGDGQADERVVWHNGKTLTGCANDIHGPYLGPEGFIYWCKGAFAQQNYTGYNGWAVNDRAAHIFVQTIDGDYFDSIASGGMDNPVEIAFTPEGEPIFSTTFYSHPTQGRRDALVHAIYGAVFPKHHDVVDDLVRTGPLLSPVTHLGPAVPAGLMRYRNTSLGPHFRNNLISAQFNLHRIQRHILHRQGSSFQTDDIDILRTSDPNFHPTDVLEDANGDLLVIDTGGWYKLCCPSSQLENSDAFGGIYRLSAKPQNPASDPWGRHLDIATQPPEKLVAILSDERPSLRQKAIEQIRIRGHLGDYNVKEGLLNLPSEAARRLLWACASFSREKLTHICRIGLHSDRLALQEVAASLAGKRQLDQLVPSLLELVSHQDFHLRRKVISALTRIGTDAATPRIFSSLDRTTYQDEGLRHATIYYLIRCAKQADLQFYLNQSNPSHLSTAAIAITEKLGAPNSEVINRLSTLSLDWATHPSIAWLKQRHWQFDIHDLQRYTTATNLDPNAQNAVRSILGRNKKSPKTLPLARQLLERSDLTNELRASLLSCLATDLTRFEQTVIQNFELLIKEQGGHALSVALDSLADARPKVIPQKIERYALQLADNESLSSSLRAAAIHLLTDSGRPLSASHLGFLLSTLNSSTDAQDRSRVVEILGQLGERDELLHLLLSQFPALTQLEFRTVLTPFRRPLTTTLIKAMAKELRANSNLAKMGNSDLSAIIEQQAPTNRARLQSARPTYEETRQEQAAILESRLSRLPIGSAIDGQKLFQSQRTACFSCHEIGYVGGKLGPDLSRIGSIRTRRDLLEAILYPSASFVRSYEPVDVELKSGEQLSGILIQNSDETLTLRVGLGNERQILRGDVTRLNQGVISLMPQGLTDHLTDQELADLLSFLQALR